MKSLDILFEDSEIIVVNKPQGVYVHPSPGHESNTMTDIIKSHFPLIENVGSRERPGVVHRLDAETSGVMVFAKNQKSYLFLRSMFESHKEIEKVYLAVLHSVPNSKEGTIETTIGRKPWDPKRMAVNVEGGARAISHWVVLAKRGGLSLVEFRIETGRTHQIRLHAAYMGCPIVGDSLYGDKVKDRHLRVKPTRQLLHAVSLSFPHPITKKRMTFSAIPPSDIVYISR